MADQRQSPSSIHDFATWEPLLRLLGADRERRDGGASAGSVRVAGRIREHGWSLDLRRPRPAPGRALQMEDVQEEHDAAERVQGALADAGIDNVSFSAEIYRTGRVILHLFDPSPAVEAGVGNPHPGALVLVDGAVPEPWRRLPDPVTGTAAAPAPSADPEALARSLRERLPGAIGATEEEIAAAETRLGFALPAELKALYGVTRARWEDHDGDDESEEREAEALGCEPFDLDGLYVADASYRRSAWGIGALEAVNTPPDAAVQGLVGSPGWIVFGDNGGGDRLAVDLTPGPRGHVGQVILLSHEEDTGAALIADSLTDLVLGRLAAEAEPAGPRKRQPPMVARVNIRNLKSVEAAAHPRLEVLSIGVWEGAPLSLAPVLGLPGLRTLTAYPGTLADPLEIAGLTGLEFLELGPEDWRVLLDADAVPRGLSAAEIIAHGEWNPLPYVTLANEILALWDRPLIVQTILEGELSA
ncbi:SMI1/KNR4 family protein [Streptomyces sp. NPDC002276]